MEPEARRRADLLIRRTPSRAREFEDAALVHLDMLYRVALRLTHSRPEAEDLVQETCLRAFRSFHRFIPGTNCRAWLVTIMRNLFLNRLRRDRHETLDEDPSRWESADSATGTDSISGNPEEELLQTILHGDVDRAIRALPVVFREVVVLVDLEGLSYREVSDAQGCPIGTVMSRLFRGRRLLRQSLRRFAREHGYVRSHRHELPRG